MDTLERARRHADRTAAEAIAAGAAAKAAAAEAAVIEAEALKLDTAAADATAAETVAAEASAAETAATAAITEAAATAAATDEKPGAESVRVTESTVTIETFVPSDATVLIEALEKIQKDAETKPLDPRCAAILARLALLADRLSSAKAPGQVFRLARIAARAAAAGPDHVPFAETIVNGLEDQISTNAPAYLVLRGLLTSFVGVLVIGALFAMGTFAIVYFSDGEQNGIRAFNRFWDRTSTNILVVSAVFGLLGSLVSVLLRLGDFDGSRRSRQFLILTGAVLPFVAAIFAMVACALFASGIVGTNLIEDAASTNTTVNLYFYIVLGFVAGFSERFARDLIGVFERKAVKEQDAGKDGTNGQTVREAEATGGIR
jgi:hypothetical protein